MVSVAEETNVEVLRAYTLWLQSEMKALTREVTELRNENEAAKQDWLDDKLQDQRSCSVPHKFDRLRFTYSDRLVGCRFSRLKCWCQFR